ncbi:MAG: TolB protein [Solirubrobacteraceae bacterium]|nr:TolB protein [Solirubrobacteraceae bacterium]
MTVTTVLLVVSLPVAVARATFRGTNGRIAFTASDAFESNIFSMNKDGTGRTDLTIDENETAFGHSDPACSPDGARIAYIVIAGNSNGALAVMDANGANKHVISSQQHAASAPAWSPDASKIVYTQYGGANNQLVVSNADGSNPVMITGTHVDPVTGRNLDGENDQADWSPDGTKIAFASNRDGDWDIYTVTVATGAITQLTNAPGFDSEPSWAPGGGRIAFTSARTPRGDVWVMRSDGSAQVNVTNSLGADWSPSWSPDGTKIAFTSRREGESDIFKMNTDGTLVKRLAQLGDTPSWCGATS